MSLGFLTDADKALLNRLLKEAKQRPTGTPGRAGDDALDHSEILLPEVYVAKAPAGGIPAITDGSGTGTGTGTGGTASLPGSADCLVYRVLRRSSGVRYLAPVKGLYRTVCNLLGAAVGGYEWVLVVRDKWGTWFLTEAPAEQSAQTYVCLSPAGGIPAMASSEGTGSSFGTGTGSSGGDYTTPGAAVCTVYKLKTETYLVPQTVKIRVHNLSFTAIPGHRWFTAHKDAYGQWYAGEQWLEFGTC